MNGFGSASPARGSVHKAPACVNRNRWFLCATSICCTDINPTARSTHAFNDARHRLCCLLQTYVHPCQILERSSRLALPPNRWSRQGHCRSPGSTMKKSVSIRTGLLDIHIQARPKKTDENGSKRLLTPLDKLSFHWFYIFPLENNTFGKDH